MPKLTLVPGEIFGHLTVINEVPFQQPRRVLCRCSCGSENIHYLHGVACGRIASCGKCLNHRKTHGLSQHPVYHIWCNLVKRCTNPDKKDAIHYKNRGITVCKEWENSPETFIADMYPSYEIGLQLDRKDNNGPYSKDNCRWVTAAQNCRNRRSNLWVLLNGEKMILTDAAKRMGLGKTTLRLWIGQKSPMVYREHNVELLNNKIESN